MRLREEKGEGEREEGERGTWKERKGREEHGKR